MKNVCYVYRNLVKTCFSQNRLSSNTEYQKILRRINATVSCLNLNEISFYNKSVILRGLYSDIVLRL